MLDCEDGGSWPSPLPHGFLGVWDCKLLECKGNFSTLRASSQLDFPHLRLQAMLCPYGHIYSDLQTDRQSSFIQRKPYYSLVIPGSQYQLKGPNASLLGTINSQNPKKQK